MSRRKELIEITEKMIRERGYNGFSIRDVAAAAGIKSASVYYYFPDKKDLGIGVTQKYTENFINTISEINTTLSLYSIISEYIELFKGSYMKDKNLCLCAVLASEKGSLPKELSSETSNFFQENLKWLTTIINEKGNRKGKEMALLILATLEGGLLVTNSLEKPEIFDDISAQLLRMIKLK